MNKSIVASIAAVAALLSSSSVFAAGWTYNPPVTATHQPTATYYPPAAPAYPQHPVYAPPASYCSPADREFLDTMHAMDVEQIALANLALARSGDPRVRDYAMQVLRDQAELENVLRSRAAQLGVRLYDRQEVSFAGLDYMRGPSFDIAYLERSMNSYDGVRRYFADFKSSVGGRFHEQLQCSFDQLVSLREIAKPLHDDIRNRSRYENRDYGYNEYGNGRGYGRHGNKHDRR